MQLIKNRNNIPNIIATIPMTIIIVFEFEVSLLSPVTNTDNPKKIKLKPTITEIKSDENIGNIIRSKPTIIVINPLVFSNDI